MPMSAIEIPRLGADPRSPFPPASRWQHPEGLVAWGGDLHPARLLNAYQNGIFPWYEPGSPILWWSPRPRAVMIPGAMTISRRLKRRLRQGRFEVRLDTCFETVIAACAAPRDHDGGTWITPKMLKAYCRLHALGHAHSVEIFIGEKLAGGLYGVAIGKIFFAESKFHHVTDASKIDLAILMRCLEQWDFLLADCQIWNPHLERLGVRLLDREDFLALVDEGCRRADPPGSWTERLAKVDLNWTCEL